MIPFPKLTVFNQVEGTGHTTRLKWNSKAGISTEETLGFILASKLQRAEDREGKAGKYPNFCKNENTSALWRRKICRDIIKDNQKRVHETSSKPDCLAQTCATGVLLNILYSVLFFRAISGRRKKMINIL